MARVNSQQRAKILDAAIGVFADKGLKGATTRQVGAAAGVNSALLYYYFEDKHTLFVEALEFVLTEFLGRLAMRRRAFASARERLEYLVDGILDYFTENPKRMGLLMQAFVLLPDLLSEALSHLLKDRPIVPLEVLGEGVARGELRPAHPLQAWWSMIGMCLFSLQVRKVAAGVDPSVIPVSLPTPAERRSQIVDLVVEGLAVNPSEQRKRRR